MTDKPTLIVRALEEIRRDINSLRADIQHLRKQMEERDDIYGEIGDMEEDEEIVVINEDRTVIERKSHLGNSPPRILGNPEK